MKDLLSNIKLSCIDEQPIEYIFVGNTGIVYVFHFTKIGRKKFVHVKKTDAFEIMSVGPGEGIIPQEGYFTWEYERFFGKDQKGMFELIAPL